MRTPGRLADRRFMQVILAAWIVIYAVILWKVLRVEIPRDGHAYLLAFAVVFLAMVAALLTVIVVVIPLRIILNLALKDRRRSHRTETILLTAVLVLIVACTFE